MVRFALLAFLLVVAPSDDLTEWFEFQPARVPRGKVFHYVKSNIDGSHASRVAQFVAAEDRLASVKWTPGRAGITLVEARIDWQTFSVQDFRTWRIGADGTRQEVATMSYDPGSRSLQVQAGGFRGKTEIQAFPWHSYDFDLASLSLALPHLIDPEGGLTFGIYDAGAAGIEFKGNVDLDFLAEEKRHQVRCRKFRIDGPGLQNRGGLLWADAEAGHIVDFEIDLPDESGYVSSKLQLRETETLDDADWEQRVAAWARGET